MIFLLRMVHIILENSLSTNTLLNDTTLINPMKKHILKGCYVTFNELGDFFNVGELFTHAQ